MKNLPSHLFHPPTAIVVGTGADWRTFILLCCLLCGAKSHNAIIIIVAKLSIIISLLSNAQRHTQTHSYIFSVDWNQRRLCCSALFIDYTIWTGFVKREQRNQSKYLFYFQTMQNLLFFRQCIEIHCFWLRFVLTSDIILGQIAP